MKTLQKLLTALLCLVMVLSCAAVAFATEGREGEVNQQAFQAEHAVDPTRTLTFGIQEYSIGIDPAQEVNTAWNCSRYGVGECLFRFDNAMNVVNWLCDEYTVNDEHTVWSFHIREGVKFSDGCDLTAEAVKASFERLFEAGKSGSSKPATYMSADSQMVVDGNTLTVTTPAPVVDLTKNLCYPVMIILDTAHTTDYVSSAIGTGPYIATNFREHVGFTMVRNENYWNGSVPYESIELLYMGDASAKAMALKAGQIDLAENITNIADLNTLRNDPAYTVTIASGVRTGITHMNLAEGRLLSNETLRHALIKSIDREAMCEITVGGLYTAGYSVLPSNLDYGYKNLVDPDPYDPDEAMRIMDEAGIIDRNRDGIREMPDGTPVMLKYVTYPNRCLDTFAEAIQMQLEEVGIGIDLIITDGAGQWDSYQSGDFDLNSSNWTTVGTGDPSEYMDEWRTGVGYCSWNNAEFDALFDELDTCFDNARRKAIIQQMQQLILDDAAAFPLGYYNSSMISRNSAVGGAAINTADYYWITTDIYPAA